MKKYCYLLSCASAKEGGGIYRYGIPTGESFLKEDYFPCDKPMYGVKKEDLLHILLRCPFDDSENSGYFTVNPDFSEKSAVQNTKGKCACHLCVSGGDTYFVNYLSGNVVKNGETVVTHTGKGPNPLRQEAAHTHYVGVSKDGLTVMATDLGLDTLFLYDRDLKEIGKVKVPEGYGIRHLVLSADGNTLYAVNELVPSVMKFSVTPNGMVCQELLPLPCEKADSTAAAIRLSDENKKLYVSVRSENVIFTVNLEKEKMEIETKTDCHGKGPRDFDIVEGNYLICCNENSDNVTVFQMENGKIGALLHDIPMRTPLCIIQ